MTLTYLVTVTIDEAKIREDRPPDGVGAELRDEIASHLDSVADVFAIMALMVSEYRPGTPPAPSDAPSGV